MITINTCNTFNIHHNIAGSDNANVRLASSSMRKYGLHVVSLFFLSAICFARIGIDIGIENALINMNLKCFVFLFLFESKRNLLTSPLFSRDGLS
jgi:hypothetical protein